MSIKKKAISGVKWTGVSTLFGSLSQILKIAILARFLSPDDFGLMALAMVVIGFTQTFADGGVSNAIIYKQDIDKKQLSSLYWFNVFIGFFLFILILIITPLFSSFYGEEELKKIIPIIGITVLLQSFSFQFRALFEKELRFDLLSKAEVLSKFLSLLFAVFLAYEGYKVYALVYSFVLMVLSEVILVVFYGLKIHRPSFYFSFRDILFFVRFGMFQLGERLTNYFTSQLDVILIGKLLGTDTVGIYSVVKQVVMRPAYLINPVITRVSFPIMSKFQNDIRKLKDIYLKTVKYVASINFFVYWIMIVLAPELIYILLGEKWLPYATVFQLLSGYFMFRSIGNPVGSLILARGKPDVEFYWNIVMVFYISLWIVLGSIYGIIGVSFSLAASHLILITVDWYFLVRKMCKAEFFEYHREILNPLIISSVVGLLTLIFKGFLSGIFVKIVVLGITGTLIYFGLNYIFNRDFIKLSKEIIHR
ncbi:MAG: colanic acid exporter [Aquificota bacterium]|nr:MAG: colanic acid exporter [Aquificota bacterium]